ncbi:MAG: hypothetical protein AAF488_19205, partial [Planctomycetota bacterium]
IATDSDANRAEAGWFDRVAGWFSSEEDEADDVVAGEAAEGDVSADDSATDDDPGGESGEDDGDLPPIEVAFEGSPNPLDIGDDNVPKPLDADIEGDGRKSSATGQIFDRLTGEPIPNAQLRITFFEAAGIPEGELLGIAGTPALEAVRAKTDANGGFSVPAFRPDDPAVLAHVQVMIPSYVPLSCVLTGRASSRGTYRRVVAPEGEERSALIYPTPNGSASLEVYLRSTLTTKVRFVGGERPLAHLPVRVETPKPHHWFVDLGTARGRGAVPVVARNGRMLQPGEPIVLFTNARGELDLPFLDAPHSFELLHPGWFLVHKVEGTTTENWGKVAWTPSSFDRQRFGQVSIIGARTGYVVEQELLDEDREPIRNSIVELDLGGMPKQRLVSDVEGIIRFAVLEYPIGVPPLSFANPRSGRLTFQCREFFRRSLAVEFPTAATELRVESIPERVYRMRLVTGDPKVPSPVPARDLRCELNLLPVSFRSDGVLEFSGSLPRAGSDSFRLCVAGYLPTLVGLHDPRPEERVVDLGDVRLEPGWTQKFLLEGISDAQAKGGEFSIVPREDPFAVQRLPLSSDGNVTVSGLSGQTYDIQIGGPWVEPTTSSAVLTEVSAKEPIPIQVTGNLREAVRVQ